MRTSGLHRAFVSSLFLAVSGAALILRGCCTPGTSDDDPPRVGLHLLASGLVAPVKLVGLADGSGRLFVVDQIGLIRVIDAGGSLRDAPLLDLRSRMVSLSPTYDERGLLGLALHPQFASNGRLFAIYTAGPQADIPAGFDHEVHVSEFAISDTDDNVADPASERVVLRFGQPQGNHVGGDLEFGPDGYLYVSVGDGGNQDDVGQGHTADIGNGQDRANLNGKILRIDVDHDDPYAIPADNPFVSVAGARSEIFAMGFRNPYRIAFDTAGAQRLFAGDVGQARREEVNIVVAGGNYGWNIREGSECLNVADDTSPLESCSETGAAGEPLRAPIIEYRHPDSGAPDGEFTGRSVIGGRVYRGTVLPALAGRYVFADWSQSFGHGDGRLLAAREEPGGTWSLQELAIAGFENERSGAFVLGMSADAAGELYVLTSDHLAPTGTTGRVYHIVPAPDS
ncbi:MAG: PQQ-dependent sugar dehydrogenase [Phycisphaerae bacterium]